MNHLHYIMLLCAGISTVSLSAKEEWTLSRCIDYAIEHNITVKQYENTKRSNEIELNTSRHNRLPNVTAGASQSFSFGRSLNADNSYVSRNTSSSSGDLSMSVPIFSGFRL